MTTDSVSHPVGEGRTRTDRWFEWINTWSFRLGLLGPVGLLGYLESAVPALAIMELFMLFWLFFLVPPALALVRYAVDGLLSRFGDGSDPADGTAVDGPGDWIESGYESSPLKALQILLVMVHPAIVVQGMFQIVGTVLAVVRHRGSPPSPATHESDVDYRLPFDGEWTTVNGSPDRWYSHSWFPIQQRYAYDFVVTDADGRSHDGSGGVESFYCFDEPMLAPADGTVVAAKDGHRDSPHTTGWLDPLQYRIFGNYVVVDHGDEYSVLAHLREGSVAVSPGDRVERGEPVGRCGHSGNSSEPHLHFQVQDHPRLYLGAGLPVQFDDVTTDHPDAGRTHYERGYVHSGQRVSYEPTTDPASAGEDDTESAAVAPED
ncbi:murein hydrolase activator EnvC family protein [Haloarchaeobius salinus]|uniref:murein hydrolase activator EnvC family protein n=1 Tax=Haloarchaeobius salinus TaxID=1198298 RepID=UPI00210A203E|nr:M23 family metallopeptidase [Haloarchaeobius salinus]